MKVLVASLAVALAFAEPSKGLTQEDETVYAITGGKIHTLSGEAIEEGTILIRGGKISEVGASVTIPSGAEVIDATGLEVYPGMMDSVTQLGLTEVGSTAATVDSREMGEFNPQLAAATAVHPSSEHIPVARANGITHAVAAPGGRGSSFGILGQASLVNLDGWTVEEMAVDTSVGMVLEWPTLTTTRFNPATFRRDSVPFSKAQEQYEENLAALEDWMESARRYAKSVASGDTRLGSDLKLEALSQVTSGDLPMMVLADDDRDIRNAVEFAEAQNLRMILLSGQDAWKEKELLAEKKIPVILGPTLTLPSTEDEPYDKPLTTASELQAAGVKVIFASFGSSNSRLLPYEAGNAVAHGLPWEEALKGITLYPAELFGVADELGSIEEGKRANLIVTTGDPLEIDTRIQHLFIDGKPTSMDNKHLELYEKYRARPR